ncbi:MAG TPA: alpha/beta fold hydrolase [Bryobacteraceae bacterium]|nr:alpha/beta fold hydrolase [Bryobacteraceae bacterium]
MARFVLVHGAFSGGWIWEPLAKRLIAAGHSVDAPDLPGLGEDYTPPAQVTLASCAARVCEALQRGSEPAVLVGNSMGGLVATQAAAHCPDRVAALVYATAFAPHDGQSLLDLTQLPEGAGDQVQANITMEGNPPVAIMSTAASRDALYGSCSEDVAAWAIAKQRPQPVAPFVTPVSIPAGALDNIPRFYVLCLRDRAITAALQRRMSREAGCAEVVELDTDHTPHLSMPDQLSDALNQFAASLKQGRGRQLGAFHQ